MIAENENFFVRLAEKKDTAAIIDLCKLVYVDSVPWNALQLESHQNIFPQGQLVVVQKKSGDIVGFAASLIIFWDDYDPLAPWRDFTDAGMFTNHDPTQGRTLYGAEIMIRPDLQGLGAGKTLYLAREKIAKNLGLLRIRAGARLRGYSAYAEKLNPEEYTQEVIANSIWDPTLSFQLRRGFHVLRIIKGYLRQDSESLGYAVLIEWINPEVATEDDYDHLIKSKFTKITTTRPRS